MPELPEVQTIVNDLQILTGDNIIGFWTNFKKAINPPAGGGGFEKEIIGKKILGIERSGKNVVLKLADKKAVVIHLKMTGKLLISNQSPVVSNQNTNKRHLHHIFYLKKNGVLEFHDIRKFATIELITTDLLEEIKKNKGIDPLSKEFTLKKFTEIIGKKKNKNIKSILMDQASISGIGNIYASEIPFDAKINPLRKIDTLNELEIKSLYRSILRILKKAIRLRGTSISDYRDAGGKKGGFQHHLKVYGKAGKKCIQCDTMIERNIVEQRSTFHCPTCQK